MLLREYLKKKVVNERLSEIILSFEKSSKAINKALLEEDKSFSENHNVHWENQMSLDIICDEIMIENFKNLSWVACLVSEEQDEKMNINDSWDYTIAYDPIDWSSLLDVNLSVGSIFWIFEWKDIVWKKVKDMCCAWCLVYWPRITLLISFWDDLNEFTLSETWDFILSKSDISLKKDTKNFSPWNLRACRENPKYKKCIDLWLEEWKTLRYSGWMVPDVWAIFLKWEWIFSYPSHSKYPNWKLRLAYEVGPFSFLAKACGWTSLTEKWEEIVDLEIKDIHQRCPIIVGSKNEVERVVRVLC